jgi:polyisoprenoid-binding protein YceI
MRALFLRECGGSSLNRQAGTAPSASQPMTIPHRLRRPHTRRGWLLSTAVAIPLALIAVFAAVYLTLFQGSSATPLALTQSTATTGPSLSTGQVLGTWRIGSGSVAGYRVRENLFIATAASDAVGRTASITGTMTLTGTSNALVVSAASFTVDVSKLSSDQTRRDDHIRTDGLESNTYPNASFVLGTPLSLPAAAASGASFKVSATGQLTIHGVTKTVTIPISARLSGGSVEVAGSISFPFEQFGMSAPSIAGFVTVQDHATMEFDLHLSHA